MNTNTNSTLANKAVSPKVTNLRASEKPGASNGGSSHAATSLQVQDASDEGYEINGLRLTVNSAEDREFSDNDSEDESSCEEQSDLEDHEDFRPNSPKPCSNQNNLDVEGYQQESDAGTKVHLRQQMQDQDWDGSSVAEHRDKLEEAEAMRLLAENPNLENVFRRMIRDGIREETQNLAHPNPQVMEKQTQKTKGKKHPNNIITAKSPSDTTIYAPALNKVQSEQADMVDKISNFVEEICIAGQSREQTLVSAQSNSREVCSDSAAVQTAGPSAKDATENFIVEAEKFKAAVEAPRGEFKHDNSDDNDYFHLACHIDSILKAKIERGEFIELDKLLPKLRPHKQEGHLEWVSKDGITYLAPAQDKENRVNGIRKWDQAFRIYAAIYCAANPGHAGEVWQYIHVINSAAASYQWDNVAYYDYTFHQMMSERPNRSWSKTYTQLWQLAMRDPIQKQTSNQSHGSGYAHDTAGTSGYGNTNQKHKTWRDNCCWRFNHTGKCDQPGCKFDNRCSYCGAWNSHRFNTCKKPEASPVPKK